MGKARNNGAGSWMTRWRGRKHPQVKGVPVPGTGVHRWHKEGTGSNKAGLLTGSIPWESGKGNKMHDAERNINNAARQQAITEQTADALDQSYDNARRDYDEFMDYPSYGSVEEAGINAIYSGEFGPGVLVNGKSAEYYEDHPETAEIEKDAELIVLRAENEQLKTWVAYLEARYGHGVST